VKPSNHPLSNLKGFYEFLHYVHRKQGKIWKACAWKIRKKHKNRRNSLKNGGFAFGTPSGVYAVAGLFDLQLPGCGSTYSRLAPPATPRSTGPGR